MGVTLTIVVDRGYHVSYCRIIGMGGTLFLTALFLSHQQFERLRQLVQIMNRPVQRPGFSFGRVLMKPDGANPAAICAHHISLEVITHHHGIIWVDPEIGQHMLEVRGR